MLPVTQPSEQFRMGIREARKAMAGGGLLGAVNLERREQILATLETRNCHEFALALHSMAGPFNLRMLSKDIDSSFMNSAEKMSMRLLAVIVSDVFGLDVAGDPLVLLNELIEAMCNWIDFTKPAQDACAGSQSAQAAHLMAESLGQDINGPDALAVRLHSILRFAPALGVIETVLGIPSDHPMLQRA